MQTLDVELLYNQAFPSSVSIIQPPNFSDVGPLNAMTYIWYDMSYYMIHSSGTDSGFLIGAFPSLKMNPRENLIWLAWFVIILSTCKYLTNFKSSRGGSEYLVF